METINYRMRLYGLDNVKSDTYLTQINNNFGQNEVERVPADIAKKIRTTMIQNHEDKLKADG
jgi:hypothetical protein